MSCSKEEAIKRLREEGYILWPPDYTATRQQCFMCGQWQSVRMMKPVRLSGLTEIVCATCFNKLEARDDALSIEMERSLYGGTAGQPGEGSAFSGAKKSRGDSGENGPDEGEGETVHEREP